MQTKQTSMKTDLSTVLSVSGQHGLYRYLAQSRGGIIVESLADGNRLALGSRSKVNALSDIAIYTSEGEMKLQEVFLALKAALGDAEVPSTKADADEVKALFAKAVPDYDEDRFYISHMRKVLAWYADLDKYASLDFMTDEDRKDDGLSGEEEDKPAGSDEVNE